MLNIETALIGGAIHMLIWEKLPEWGTWFNAILQRLPQPLQTLYGQWRCPYCAGFWIALVLHALTGLWTLPALATLPGFPLQSGAAIGWFLDALVTAMLIQAVVLAANALRLPAMKAVMMKEEFMKEVFGKDTAHSR